MKNITILQIITMLLACITLTSCELVGDIFKAGVWTGGIGIILLIVLVIGGFFWLLRRGRG